MPTRKQMTPVPPAIEDFLVREFTCPYCEKPTGVRTPFQQTLMTWTMCTNCHKEFLVEDDKPTKAAN